MCHELGCGVWVCVCTFVLIMGARFRDRVFASSADDLCDAASRYLVDSNTARIAVVGNAESVRDLDPKEWQIMTKI